MRSGRTGSGNDPHQVASVAQLAEQLTLNQLVLGSSPSRGTNSLRLPRHQVIKRPHFSIFPRRADYHFFAGELMKEKGRSPGIHHFAVLIHAHTGFRRDEINMSGISSHQGGGDFRVGADWIFTEFGTVVVNDDPGLVQDCQRRQSGRSVCIRNRTRRSRARGWRV